MVYRVFVEKKKELANEAKALSGEIKNLLKINGVKNLSVINRYDVEDIEKDLFDKCVSAVFSENRLCGYGIRLGQAFWQQQADGRFSR